MVGQVCQKAPGTSGPCLKCKAAFVQGLGNNTVASRKPFMKATVQPLPAKGPFPGAGVRTISCYLVALAPVEGMPASESSQAGTCHSQTSARLPIIRIFPILINIHPLLSPVVLQGERFKVEIQKLPQLRCSTCS